MRQLVRELRGGAWLCALAGGIVSLPASADVVTEWQVQYQQVIRQTGGAPCPISRSGPMISVAMYDAINAIDRVEDPNGSFEPYQHDLPPVTPGTSRTAAAAAAAYTVLSELHGSGLVPPNDFMQLQFEAKLAESLAGIPEPGRTLGVEFGTTVANMLLEKRANDGYDGDPTYVYGGQPGDFRVTPDGPNLPAFSPHWGACTPWAMVSGDQFRPSRFEDLFNYDMTALLTSNEYVEQIHGGPGVLGVMEYGERDSAVRTEEQTLIAWFWANDRDGTYKPPGHCIEISLVVSAQEQLTLSENARMFALVGMGLADACVGAWEAKYKTPIDLWRPIDGCRETLDDGNPNTVPDPDWLPLNDFTPPFPAWISGHASFGGVHSRIMERFLGTDDVTFTVGSDEFVFNPFTGFPHDTTRTFTSFSQAGYENALSRVYLGVHYQWDADDAYNMGREIADWVFDHKLGPACPSDFNDDNIVGSEDLNAVLKGFGCVGDDCAGDINRDGKTDSLDLNFLLTVFGQGCP